MKKLFTVLACAGVMAASAVTADAASSKLYIIGEPAGGWAANKGTELTEKESGVFTYSGTFTKATYFGFADELGTSANDWNTLNAHRYNAPAANTVPSGTTNAMTYSGADRSWMLPAGEYTMTIDTNTMNLSMGDGEIVVEIGDLYLRGGMNEWAATDAWKFTKNGDVYTLSDVTIPAATPFKVGNADWTFDCAVPYENLSSIELDKVYTYATGQEDNNMSFAAATKVTVVVNTADETIEFKSEGGDPIIPTDPYTYTIHGQITGNADWESIALTNKDGKWEYTGKFVAGDFGIKQMEGTVQKAWISAAPGYVDVTEEGTYNAMVNGTNWSSTLEGNYTLSFDPAAMTVTFTKYEGEIEIVVTYALRGNITTGEWTDLEMTKDAEGNWSWSGTVVPGEFGIKKMENGAQAAWYASADEVATINSSGNYSAMVNGTNWASELEGKAAFTFNPETLVLTASGTTAVENVEVAEDGEAVYFNLQGVRVDNPANGVFVRVLNGKATKVVM